MPVKRWIKFYVLRWRLFFYQRMSNLGLIPLPGDEVPDPNHHLDVLLDLLGHGEDKVSGLTYISSISGSKVQI